MPEYVEAITFLACSSRRITSKADELLALFRSSCFGESFMKRTAYPVIESDEVLSGVRPAIRKWQLGTGIKDYKISAFEKGPQTINV